MNVAACLRRIQQREHAVKAWTYVDPEPALDGLPVGVKDIFDTAGMPTACG